MFREIPVRSSKVTVIVQQLETGRFLDTGAWTEEATQARDFGLTSEEN